MNADKISKKLKHINADPVTKLKKMGLWWFLKASYRWGNVLEMVLECAHMDKVKRCSSEQTRAVLKQTEANSVLVDMTKKIKCISSLWEIIVILR